MSKIGITIGAVLIGIFMLSFSANAAVIIRPAFYGGLIGYWSFNEGAGITAYDTAVAVDGKFDNGTLTSMDAATDWMDGTSGQGKALDFDGSDDNVDIGASFDSLDGSSSFTVSAWVNTDTLTGGENSLRTAVGQEGGAASDSVFMLRLDTGNDEMEFFVGGNDFAGATTGASSISADTWYHVVGTYDGSDVKIFLDGVEKDSTGETSGTGSGSDSLRIGETDRGGNDDRHWSGLLDEVRIYNRALSSDEVVRLVNISRPRITTPLAFGLTGYWSFNEGSGIHTAYDTAVATDGVFNNGALVSITNASWVDGTSGQGTALDFDGGSDWITVDNANIDSMVNYTEGTIALWVNFDNVGGSAESLWEVGTDANNFIQLRKNSGTSLRFRYNTSGTNDSVNLNPSSGWQDVWHHVVGVWSADGLFLYDNGVLVDSDTSRDAADNSGLTGMRIAQRAFNTASAFNGQLDEVRLYNRALSAEEILRLANVQKTRINTSQTGRLTNGLVGMWSFDGPDMWEGGTIAVDRGSGGVNGVVTTAKATIGKVGQALLFDQSNDYVTLTGEGSDFSFNDFTVSAWVRRDGTGNNTWIFDNRDGTDDGWLFAIKSDDKLDCIVGGNTLSTGIVFDSELTHVACTQDSTTGRIIYVNGVNTASNGNTNSVSETTDATIGARSFTSPSNKWPGMIDEVRVYNRALSGEEIKLLYSIGR